MSVVFLYLKIAHIKRRVPLGEKTTHIDKAQMQNGYCKAERTFKYILMVQI